MDSAARALTPPLFRNSAPIQPEATCVKGWRLPGGTLPLKEMTMHLRTRLSIAVSAAALILAGCAGQGTQPSAGPDDAVAPVASEVGVGGGPKPKRSLASFAKANGPAACYDREKEPFTAVVDAHFHPRPFGGPAITPQELFKYFDEAGVRFVNYFGIGQVLDLKSGCTYYLD